jgi:hypothetical protein
MSGSAERSQGVVQPVSNTKSNLSEAKTKRKIAAKDTGCEAPALDAAVTRLFWA